MHLLETKRMLELVWVKATMNLKSEASVNYLSYVWWIVEPLLHMSVYYLVFSVLLNRGGEDYVIFLLTGLIPWLWFSKSVSRASNSIIKGKTLMGQIYVPKLFFPLTSLTQDTIKQIIVWCILLVFVGIVGPSPSIVWFWLVPIILTQLLLICAFSLCFALIIPFIRDFSLIIPSILQFIMFCSGIFFSYKDISSEIQNLFFINPMAVLLRCYRDVLLDGVGPVLPLLIYVFSSSFIVIIICLKMYKELDFKLPRVSE